LRQKLEESGYFLFVNTRKWEMTEKDKKLYGPAKLQNRRSKKDELKSFYWLVHLLRQEGFDFIFKRTQLGASRQLAWLPNGVDEDG